VNNASAPDKTRNMRIAADCTPLKFGPIWTGRGEGSHAHDHGRRRRIYSDGDLPVRGTRHGQSGERRPGIHFALAIVAAVNMWFGVNRAGYTYADEFPIFLLIFAVPAVVAAWLWWNGY
jgi:hypothetical protein